MRFLERMTERADGSEDRVAPARLDSRFSPGAARARERAPPARDGSTRPSILLVTLDTTRADAIGPDAEGVETPAFDALARRGPRFRQAYATVPETLPSHASMMTGLYPAGHGVHENARYPARRATRSSRSGSSRPATARPPSSRASCWRGASVSRADSRSTTTSSRPGGPSGRPGRPRTGRSRTCEQAASQPLFVWVHYFDPHAPYAPPEPFRSRYARNPYLGEVAAMDAELGRLVAGVRGARPRAASAIVVVSDHGEGLGDHGESAARQPALPVDHARAAAARRAGRRGRASSDAPVSTRRVFHTILDWAGLGATDSLRAARAGDRARRGHEAVPLLRLAAAGDGGRGPARRRSSPDGSRSTTSWPTRRRRATSRPGATLSRPLRTALREYPLPSLARRRAPGQPRRGGAAEAREPRAT